jgi:hypothetical protein
LERKVKGLTLTAEVLVSADQKSRHAGPPRDRKQPAAMIDTSNKRDSTHNPHDGPASNAQNPL